MVVNTHCLKGGWNRRANVFKDENSLHLRELGAPGFLPRTFWETPRVSEHGENAYVVPWGGL